MPWIGKGQSVKEGEGKKVDILWDEEGGCQSGDGCVVGDEDRER